MTKHGQLNGKSNVTKEPQRRIMDHTCLKRRRAQIEQELEAKIDYIGADFPVILVY